ncbi:MAG: sulfite exporter TauE/SafE family protein [Candidatus Omnitrophica bacterium]|nr:sulfite exporter TauE/SafE family protein [Candidatus Omnitrophota bacterium]
MIKISINLFLTGIIFGTGPCLATCGPILISYITALKKSPKGALISWLLFSASRIFVYALLGMSAGLIGSSLYQGYYWQKSSFVIWIIGGLFICLLGLLVVIGKNTHSKYCLKMQDVFLNKDKKSIIILGLVIGLFPCIPLIGIISYISMISVRFYQGIVLMLCFGLGTIISPLIFLSLGAGLVTKLKILRNENIYVWLQKAAGIVLFSLGVHILVKTITGYIR